MTYTQQALKLEQRGGGGGGGGGESLEFCIEIGALIKKFKLHGIKTTNYRKQNNRSQIAASLNAEDV